MEAVANAGATEVEPQPEHGQEAVETGIDEAEAQARFDADYKEKKERLDKVSWSTHTIGENFLNLRL